MSSLTLAQSREYLLRAIKKAEEQGAKMSFAIVDEGGNLKALARMDGASFPTAKIAEGKAFTSVAWQMSSSEAADIFTVPERLIFSTAISSMYPGRFTPGKGGLPIMKDGKIIGAMGGSGGTAEQDEDFVRNAISST